jgi:uncharacterized membrane protein YciS (DUF1049 family)
MRSAALLLVVAMVFALGLVIAYANTGAVRFDYLVGSTDVDLISLLLIVFAAGVFLTLLACAGRLLAMRGELRRARRQLRDTDAELKSLRNIPVQSSR